MVLSIALPAGSLLRSSLADCMRARLVSCVESHRKLAFPLRFYFDAAMKQRPDRHERFLLRSAPGFDSVAHDTFVVVVNTCSSTTFEEEPFLPYADN